MTWNMSTFRDLAGCFNNEPAYLMFLVCFGLSAVGAGFLFSMPVVGNVVAALWTTMIGEQLAAKVRGKESDTEMGL